MQSDNTRDIAFYEAARAESLLRVQHRDLTIFSFVAIVGAYFGFVVARQLAKPAAPDTLVAETITVLALPVICACFMLIYQQHHLLIAMIERYINRELFVHGSVPHLNNSQSLDLLRGPVHELGFFAQS